MRGEVQKDYAKAIENFDEAIRLDPKDAPAFSNRGIVWRAKKEYDKAIKDFDEALRLDPKDAATFNNRGNARYDKEEYAKAIADFDEAIRLDPSCAPVFYNRGKAWYDKKEYDKAIKDYDEAIRLEPRHASAIRSRGVAWHTKKEYAKAIKDFDEAIRLDPKNDIAFYGRGNAWCAKKEYAKAIENYDEAIRLNPKNAWSYYNRSAAWMLARRPEAVGGFQAILELQGWKGDLAPSAVILGHFAARQAGDPKRAERFLEDSAGKLAGTWLYPVVEFLRGEIDETALLKWADNTDKRTEACCFLGLDHALKGRKKEALAFFRWVKEHGNASFTEYTIAVAELDRLEKPTKRSKHPSP